MTVELKGTVINMKTLSQDINDPIVVGAGEANGRWLTVIFTQEAAAQFSENTNVYLSWKHIEKNIKGYNIFEKVEQEDTDVLTAEELPPIYQIYYPKEMLHEGTVNAVIELVDNISVSASRTFSIHVTSDPWDETDWIEQDDLSEFKIAMNRVQQLQQTVNDTYEELNLRLQELEKLHEDSGEPDEEIQVPSDPEVIDTPPEGE